MNPDGMNNIGMNPMGMNFMGMNPMGMNPMGMNQIGMINQQNFMNGETAQNIKNIIEPYENKIRELEEIIKQKDFEIIVLKQKLNNNNMPNNNFMNINPMMMNMNMNPMNNNNNPLKKHFLRIVSHDEGIVKIIECFENDKVSLLREKGNIKKGILTCNYKPLDEDLTIKKNEIKDGCTINITNQIYTISFKTYRGNFRSLLLDQDCPIEFLIFIYCIKEKKLYDLWENNITFLYNAQKLNIKDKTSIKKIFINNINPIITVILG